MRLEVTGRYAAFRAGPRGTPVAYRLVDGGVVDLPGVQWADWAADGSLLVATREGRLETRGPTDWLTPVAIVADLAGLAPTPTEPPPQARSWNG
jgi:hypothetical protein